MMSMSMSIPCGAPLAFGPPTDNLYMRLFSDKDYFTKVSGRISAWQGTGSSGKAAVQATAGFQPVEGTGINGKPTVSYAGSSRWLQVTDVTLGVFDIYVILKTSTASAIILEQSVSATAGNGNFLFTGVTEGSAVFRGGVGSSIHPNSTSWVADGNAALIRSGFGGTHASRILERDGATVAAGVSAYTGSPGVGTVTDHLNIGCRSGGTLGIFAEYGEILIYNAAPDSTRAAQILAWSRSYWGTP